MQKTEIAQTLAQANETERQNRESEIRFTSDLANFQEQEQQLLETMKTEFGVSSLADLRQLYGKTDKEDSRAVEEFVGVVNARKDLIAQVQATVAHVNSQGRG